jgi:hypothetical protein
MAFFTVHQRAGINTTISTNHHHLQAKRGPVRIVIVMSNRARRGEFFIVCFNGCMCSKCRGFDGFSFNE